MTLDQLVIVLNWLAHLGLPILVAFVLHANASSAFKAAANLLGSLVVTALITIIADLTAHTAIDWFTILFALVSGFIVSGASYSHLWKPTGAIGSAALVGGSLGE
jgi:hypothetical protein